MLTYQKAWIGFGFTLYCCSSTEYLFVGERGWVWAQQSSYQFLSPFIDPTLEKAAGEFYQTLGSDFCKERHRFRLVWCEVGA